MQCNSKIMPENRKEKSFFLPPATKLGQCYIFTGVCDSVHRGWACMARGEHVWWGGMHGRRACMAGGHAWPGGMWRGCAWLGGCAWGVCMLGGMCAWWEEGTCMAGGHTRWGACMTCIPPGRYYSYTIWSMSRRYASYWNAFLLCAKIIFEFLLNVCTHFIESSYKIIVKNYLNLQHFV